MYCFHICFKYIMKTIMPPTVCRARKRRAVSVVLDEEQGLLAATGTANGNQYGALVALDEDQ